jgi:AraC-like DNA-binding protein
MLNTIAAESTDRKIVVPVQKLNVMAFTSSLAETLDCSLAAFCKIDAALFDECLNNSPTHTNCLMIGSGIQSGMAEIAYFLPQGEIFDKKKLSDMFSKPYNFDLIFFNARINDIPFFAMPGLGVVKINNIEQIRIFNSLLNFENAHAYPFKDYMLSSTLGKIAVYILRGLQDFKPEFYSTLNAHFANARLLTILRFIHQHIQEDVTLERLAQLVDLSPDYVSQFFKRCLGMSIQSYLIDQRVKLGLYLLISGTDQISVISDDTGFVDQAYFNRRSKLVFGMNPLRLRKKYQLLFVSQAGALMTSAK